MKTASPPGPAKAADLPLGTPEPRRLGRNTSAARLAALTLLGSCLGGTAPAAVTPYCWVRMGELGTVFEDSSGNGRRFNMAYSGTPGAFGGDPGVVLQPTGVGGPLGGAGGAESAVSALWGSFGRGAAAMWQTGWTFPATDYVLEAWVLPVGTGSPAGHTSRYGQIACTGESQGIAFRTAFVFGDGDQIPDQVVIRLVQVGTSPEVVIGEPAVVSRSRWTHLAAVNTGGNLTYYVNGIASGTSANVAVAVSSPAFVGGGAGTFNPFHGYLDEVRYSTFAAGAFQLADLLTKPPGPDILVQPQSASVWAGGAAPFEPATVIDGEATYQWKQGAGNVPGATGHDLQLPSVTPAQTGEVYSVEITSDGVTLASDPATLTVVTNDAGDTDFYRDAVRSEAGLLAYFPVDGDIGLSVSNTADATRNAEIVSDASYDGRTDRSFGQRALRFRKKGIVTVDSNPEFEFSDGDGTIEALVYLEPTISAGQATIFSLAEDISIYYQVQVSLDGGSLSFGSDSGGPPVAWSVPTPLKGRFAHIALVFSAGEITAYVDGVSLGSKANPGFGFSTGLKANIGSSGSRYDTDGITLLSQDAWLGTIDELAVYDNALTASTIAVHNSRFIYGTEVAAPEITSQTSGSLTLLAGGAPALRVVSTGTAPLSYQWKRNGADVTGNPTATTPTLVLNNSTAAMSGAYTVVVSNPQGTGVSDPVQVSFTAPPDAYSASVLADNPSAFWRLGEAAGTVLKDQAGGLDGVYSSTVMLGEEGAPGLAPETSAHFAGTGTPVPNAIVPYSPVLNPQGPFSLEFWVRPDLSGLTGRAVIGNQNRNAGRSGVAVYQGLNGAYWEAHLGFAETVLFIQGTTVPEAGRWDHVVVVWDGVDTARIFVNGLDDTSAATVAGPHRPNQVTPFEIGSRFGGGLPYQGNIDEVAFYNHQLSPEQIAGHFAIDTSPPQVTYAVADASLRRVRIGFDRDMNPDSTAIAGNYLVSGGVTVTSVALTNQTSVVDLVTSGLTPGADYTVFISGVKDSRPNGTELVPVSLPFRAGILTPGFLAFDTYSGIGGTSVFDLYGDMTFPDGVSSSSTLTSFSAGPDIADNYGAHVYGWITPAVTGAYRFFLRSDDASELLLSPNENPAGADLIAAETACCNPFLEPGSPQTSDTFNLVAGRRYYIEAFNKEGGGGDFLQVAWRMEGDPAPAASLTPIPGAFLSTYVVSSKRYLPINPPEVVNGQLRLTWDEPGTLEQSPDLMDWSIVPGNPVSPFLTPLGTRSFFRLFE